MLCAPRHSGARWTCQYDTSAPPRSRPRPWPCARFQARRTRRPGRAAMQSVRDVPKRTEGHCIQTIMRRTMK